MRALRVLVRILAWSMGVAFVAAVSALILVFAVAHGFQREWLTQRIAGQLAASLQTEVEIDALDGVLYRSLEARGVRVGPAGARILDARRVAFEWADASLEPPLIDLAWLEIDGVRLHIDRARPFPWSAGAEERDSPSVEVRIARVALSDAEVEVAAEEGARAIAAGGASLTQLRSADGGFAVERVELKGLARSARTSAAALQELGRFELAGAFSSQAGFEGFSWQAERFTLRGPNLDAKGVGKGDRAGIEHAHLEFETASLTRLARDLRAVLASAEPGPGSDPFSGGAARGVLDLSGPWAALVGRLDARAEALVLGKRRVGTIEAALRTSGDAPGRIAIERLRARGGELGLGVREGTGAALRVADDRISIERTTIDLEGGGSLRIGGRLPRESSGDVQAWLQSPKFDLELAAEKLPVPRLLALAQAMPKGLVVNEAPLDAKLRVQGHPGGARASGWLEAHTPSIAWDGSRASGVQARVELRGPVAKSTGKLAATADALEATGRAVGSVRLALDFEGGPNFLVETAEWQNEHAPARIAPGSRFRIAGGVLELDGVRVESGEQRVLASGRIGPESVRGLAFEVEALSLRWVRERLRAAGLVGPDVTVQGALTGMLRLDGRLSMPSIESDLEISGFESAGVAFERVTFAARSPEDRFHLTSLWNRNGSAVMKFSLTAPRQLLTRDPLGLLDSPAVELEVKADGFDLAALEVFAPARVETLRGTLDANLRMHGGTPARVDEGSFRLTRGAVKLQTPRQTIGPIAAEGTIGTGVLVVERLAIGPEGAQLVGDVRIANLGSGDETLDGRVRFEQYPAKLTGLARGELNGELVLSGRVPAPRVAGKLVLSDVEIWLPEANAPELKEILVDDGSAASGDLSIREGEAEVSAFDRVTYDIELEMERGSWARGRGLEAELTGDLHLEKRKRRKSSYSGELRTIRGTYEVYGRRFRLDRGIVRLDGSERVDPVLDIVGKHRIRNIEIEAIIGGRLSEPSLRFESTPELSQTDIASYLLLGRPAATARGEDAAAVQSTAARLAAGIVGNELDRLLAPLLPVDVIDVRVDKEQEEDVIALGVGKYIGERLFLQYDRRFGREPVDELRAEYELTPRWSVESSAATNGEAGADLIFNIEY